MTDTKSGQLIVREPPAVYGSAVRIDRITLNNYKFFFGEFTLPVDGKNLLIYGENGSGKSSIYKALELLTEKSFTGFEENANIFGNDSEVSVEFGFTNSQELIISTDSEKLPDHVDFIKGLSIFKPLLDYKKLLKIHYVPQSNGDEINLYPMFSEILKDYPVDSGNGKAVLSDIDDMLEYFDTLKSILDDNFREAINVFLQDYFDADFSIDKFEYKTKRDKEANTAIPVVNIRIDYKAHVIEKYHTFLNEARLSALAISLYFISIKKLLGKIDGNNLKILVLDDLLISLDMSNRLKLLKILKTQFSDFQIFFFTHDKELYEIYKDKLNWKRYELYLDNHSDIPMPILKVGKSELERAKVYYAQKEYDACAMLLRKAFEKIIKNYLTPKEQRNANCEELNLSGLIGRATSKSSGAENAILQKLNSDRCHILNPLCHIDTTTIHSEELKNAIDDLEKLKKILR